jgi:hypothetical protein
LQVFLLLGEISMPIDAKTETVFTLTEAADKAEALIGRRLATSTFYRWAKTGVRGVRLETRFLGGVRYTSEEALSRFFDAITQQADGMQSAVSHRPQAPLPAASSADLRAIERELEAEGL